MDYVFSFERRPPQAGAPPVDFLTRGDIFRYCFEA